MAENEAMAPPLTAQSSLTARGAWAGPGIVAGSYSNRFSHNISPGA
jgi:hypothetical protein